MSTPSSVTERYDAIVALWKSGRQDEAVAQMLELNAAEPSAALPCAALAAWYKKLDRLDDAIKYAAQYCELAPDDSFGYSILSSYYISVGLHTEAEEALMKARDLRIAAQLEARRTADENPS